jgi:hypothetical protein
VCASLVSVLGAMAVGYVTGMVRDLWWSGAPYLLLGVPGRCSAPEPRCERPWPGDGATGWIQLEFAAPRRAPWHLCWQVPVALFVSFDRALTVGSLAKLGPRGHGDLKREHLHRGDDGEPVADGDRGTGRGGAAPGGRRGRVLLGGLLTRVPKVVAVVAATGFAAMHMAPTAML